MLRRSITGVDYLGRPYKRYVEDGIEHVQGEEPVCEFCCRTTPQWEYPAAPMEIVGHPSITHSNDDWAACPVCHALIEAHDIDGLVQHAVKSQRRTIYELRMRGMDIGTIMDLETGLRQNILRFMDARMGPPRPWSGCQ